MKQSKYSPRRPQGMPARRDIKEKHGNGISVKPKAKVTYLPLYDLGIFIDDRRTMDEVNLPEAKTWLTFKGFSDYAEWLELRDDDEVPTAKTAFISFDHYLEDVDRGRYTGDDCIRISSLERRWIGDRVDIQGHSSDNSMNDKKIDYWYNSPRGLLL